MIDCDFASLYNDFSQVLAVPYETRHNYLLAFAQVS